MLKLLLCAAFYKYTAIDTAVCYSSTDVHSTFNRHYHLLIHYALGPCSSFMTENQAMQPHVHSNN